MQSSLSKALNMNDQFSIIIELKISFFFSYIFVVFFCSNSYQWKVEGLALHFVIGARVFQDNTVAITAFLILLLQTDDTDCCNH